MPKITLSYRRNDSDAIAGRLFDRLIEHYGTHSIFRDIDNIPPGIDFRQHIDEALHETDILLAIVGPKWLGSRGGQARIGEEADPVRVEVETAMRLGIQVIPVLIGKTRMPKSSELPDPIRNFAYRNAVAVDPGRDFDHHVKGLIREMDKMLAADESGSPARPRRAERQPPRREAPPPDEPIADAADRASSVSIAQKPLCFVLMPFGRQVDSSGRFIEFDEVYRQIVAPAVAAADMQLVRPDGMGDEFSRATLERVLLCDFVVADVTGADPSVYYELGIRHSVRPAGTVIIYAAETSLSFDVSHGRSVPYRIDAQGKPTDANWHVPMIAGHLRAARENPSDSSPVFQLLGPDFLPRLETDPMRIDLLRLGLEHDRALKDRLGAARKAGEAALRELAADKAFSNLREIGPGVVLDLFFSFPFVGAWQDMVNLYGRMPSQLQRNRATRQQLGFALHRLGMSDRAEDVFRKLIEELGPNVETNGLLGRLYKERWSEARQAGRLAEAQSILRRAIDTYLAGFEADIRDPFPGVNAVLLMDMQDEPDPRQSEILSVVRFAAARRARAYGNYWDRAVLLELAVVGRDVENAWTDLAAALTQARQRSEPDTTAGNIRQIREARQGRGEDVGWIVAIETRLAEAAGAFGRSPGSS